MPWRGGAWVKGLERSVRQAAARTERSEGSDARDARRHEPQAGGILRGFADDRRKVVLQVKLPEGHSIGWARQADGSLALVGDLQRLSRSRSLHSLLGRHTRHYAAQQALQDAARELQGATIHVESSLVV